MSDISSRPLGCHCERRFLHAEVWTARGLVTYNTVFVLDVASRRAQILGSTRHPDALFLQLVVRSLLSADDDLLRSLRWLICDRDRKWSLAFRQCLDESGVHVVQTPFQAPNANAYAERFVRSLKHECLDRVTPFGEGHLRRTIAEFVEHYHRERNHQGLGNQLIERAGVADGIGRIRWRQRVGGLLNYYCRAA